MRGGFVSKMRGGTRLCLSVESAPTRVSILDKALLLQGQVTTGYGRGSKKLGVPTANLPHFDEQLGREGYANGVYLGWAKIKNEPQLLACVCNIGKSPTFADPNTRNIVEAHFLDRKQQGDFYGSFVRICLVGFLRAEQKFPSLDALIEQINKDIDTTRMLCGGTLSGDMAILAKDVAEPFLSPKNADMSDSWNELDNDVSFEQLPRSTKDDALTQTSRALQLKTLWKTLQRKDVLK